MTVAEGMTADAALDRADAILADDAGDQADRSGAPRSRRWASGSSRRSRPATTPRSRSTSTSSGLIYKIDVDDDDVVHVDMTLTSPNCPVAESLPVDVQDKVKAVEG